MFLDLRRSVESHRAALTELSGLTQRQFAELMLQTEGMPPHILREFLKANLPHLATPFIDTAGVLSAAWYDELRGMVGVRGVFAAEPDVAFIPAHRWDQMIRWAVGGLDERLESTVASRVEGALQRMIFNASREVIINNGRRERARFAYERVARPNACDFCSMLASRGAVYTSARSAGSVVGRGSERTGYDERGRRLAGGIGGGVKARGNAALHGQYHDHCHCVVAPVFQGMRPAPYDPNG